MKVPEAKAGGILVRGGVVGLGLEAGVEVDVKGVSFAPVVVVVGGEGGGVADAAVEGSPLLVTLGLSICIGVIG